MKNRKRNNKGFSMVELIIVIAIMAVLTAVTAPQYLKYVERSRESKDNTTLDEYNSALNILAADTEIELPDDTYLVTITHDGTEVTDTSTSEENETKLNKYMEEVFGSNYKGIELESKSLTKSVFTITVSGESITVSRKDN